MTLTIKNLHAGYEDLEILKGINLEIGDKQIVSLIGPNGAGKSTVIKSIFGLANVKSGEIRFDDKDLTSLKPHQLIENGICYVNQGKIIFGNLTLYENLVIGISQKNKDEIRKKLNSVYEMFPDIKDRENDLAYKLSGGQRQMLALGRALVQNPKLLLLDEPSLGLSPILQKDLFVKIKYLKEKLGISILIVEQNAKKAIQISDKVYLLEDGKIALEGSGASILSHKKIKQVYLGGRY